MNKRKIKSKPKTRKKKTHNNTCDKLLPLNLIAPETLLEGGVSIDYSHMYVANSMIGGLGVFASRDIAPYTVTIFPAVQGPEFTEGIDKTNPSLVKWLYPLTKLNEEDKDYFCIIFGFASLMNHQWMPNCSHELIDLDNPDTLTNIPEEELLYYQKTGYRYFFRIWNGETIKKDQEFTVNYGQDYWIELDNDELKIKDMHGIKLMNEIYTKDKEDGLVIE